MQSPKELEHVKATAGGVSDMLNCWLLYDTLVKSTYTALNIPLPWLRARPC